MKKNKKEVNAFDLIKGDVLSGGHVVEGVVARGNDIFVSLSGGASRRMDKNDRVAVSQLVG